MRSTCRRGWVITAAFTLATYVHLMPDDAPDPAFLDDLMPIAEVGRIDRGAAALDAIDVV